MKIVRVLALLVFLSACASQPFSEAAAKQLVAQKATVEQVKAALGEPRQVGSVDGEVTLTYLHMVLPVKTMLIRFNAQGHAVSYIYQELH